MEGRERHAAAGGRLDTLGSRTPTRVKTGSAIVSAWASGTPAFFGRRVRSDAC